MKENRISGRKRPRGGQPQCRQSASVVHALRLNELPDAALANVLGHLDLEERLSSAALVCRRWSRLTLSPQLLRCLVPKPPWKQLQNRLGKPDNHSMMRWVQRHAGPYVERLELDLSSGKSQEMQELLEAVLGAAFRSGRLQHLHVEHKHLRLGKWMLAARSLHALEIIGGTTINVPLHTLTALERLCLNSRGSSSTSYPFFGDAFSLPPSLTSLHLETQNSGDGRMPGGDEELEALAPLTAAVGSLVNLRQLSLTGHDIAKAVLRGKVAALTALQQLELEDVYAPHPNLLQLTSLRSLHLEGQEEFDEEDPDGWEDSEDEGEEGEDQVEQLRSILAAIPKHLVNLTSLYLAPCNLIGMHDLPPDFSTLPQLQCFSWNGQPAVVPMEWDEEEGAMFPAGPRILGRLPAGMHTLRVLVLPVRIALNSVAQLAAVQQLETLVLWGFSRDSVEQWDSDSDGCGLEETLKHRLAQLPKLLAAVPQLRRLCLRLSTYECPPAAYKKLCVRPDLSVQLIHRARYIDFVRKLCS